MLTNKSQSYVIVIPTTKTQQQMIVTNYLKYS